MSGFELDASVEATQAEATPTNALVEALKGMSPYRRAAFIDKFDTATPEEIRELLRLRKRCTECSK